MNSWKTIRYSKFDKEIIMFKKSDVFIKQYKNLNLKISIYKKRWHNTKNTQIF